MKTKLNAGSWIKITTKTRLDEIINEAEYHEFNISESVTLLYSQMQEIQFYQLKENLNFDTVIGVIFVKTSGKSIGYAPAINNKLDNDMFTSDNEMSFDDWMCRDDPMEIARLLDLYKNTNNKFRVEQEVVCILDGKQWTTDRFKAVIGGYSSSVRNLVWLFDDVNNTSMFVLRSDITILNNYQANQLDEILKKNALDYIDKILKKETKIVDDFEKYCERFYE